ncbi:MAG: hypothetical protein Q9167_001439 [Letrouitia subvulpina]
MPVAALKRLERAKDQTIGWILGEIEKEEKREQEDKVVMRKVQKVEREGKDGVNEEELLEAETGGVKEQKQKVNIGPIQSLGSGWFNAAPHPPLDNLHSQESIAERSVANHDALHNLVEQCIFVSDHHNINENLAKEIRIIPTAVHDLT